MRGAAKADDGCKADWPTRRAGLLLSSIKKHMRNGFNKPGEHFIGTDCIFPVDELLSNAFALAPKKRRIPNVPENDRRFFHSLILFTLCIFPNVELKKARVWRLSRQSGKTAPARFDVHNKRIQPFQHLGFSQWRTTVFFARFLRRQKEKIVY